MRILIRSRPALIWSWQAAEIFVAVSSYTGEGVEELSASLHKMVEKYKEEECPALRSGLFRLEKRRRRDFITQEGARGQLRQPMHLMATKGGGDTLIILTKENVTDM